MYGVLSIQVESNILKHSPKVGELLDMAQREALRSVDMTDPEVVMKRFADRTRLPLRYLKDLGRDVFWSEAIKP